MSLALQPFEVLLWWPAVGILTDLANGFSAGGHHGNSKVVQEEAKVGSISEMHISSISHL